MMVLVIADRLRQTCEIEDCVYQGSFIGIIGDKKVVKEEFKK